MSASPVAGARGAALRFWGLEPELGPACPPVRGASLTALDGVMDGLLFDPSNCPVGTNEYSDPGGPSKPASCAAGSAVRLCVTRLPILLRRPCPPPPPQSRSFSATSSAIRTSFSASCRFSSAISSSTSLFSTFVFTTLCWLGDLLMMSLQRCTTFSRISFWPSRMSRFSSGESTVPFPCFASVLLTGAGSELMPPRNLIAFLYLSSFSSAPGLPSVICFST
mmetsp:Transcript_61852/g.170264  ORF Transcript_61852/g.170264 Transcript_61852/m.170264 type:complete len:222 (+) Transcript_61852:674-1339(+)